MFKESHFSLNFFRRRPRHSEALPKKYIVVKKTHLLSFFFKKVTFSRTFAVGGSGTAKPKQIWPDLVWPDCSRPDFFWPDFPGQIFWSDLFRDHVCHKYGRGMFFRDILVHKKLFFSNKWGQGQLWFWGSGPENYSPDLPPDFWKLFWSRNGSPWELRK